MPESARFCAEWQFSFLGLEARGLIAGVSPLIVARSGLILMQLRICLDRSEWMLGFYSGGGRRLCADSDASSMGEDTCLPRAAMGSAGGLCFVSGRCEDAHAVAPGSLGCVNRPIRHAHKHLRLRQELRR